MAAVLPDGTVQPAHLGRASPEDHMGRAIGPITNNTRLRIGYVVGAYYPDLDGDARSRGEVPEYDVVCQQVDGWGAEAEMVYTRCRVSGGSGAVGDRCRWVPRVATAFSGAVDATVISTASRVLIECANGRSDTAVILGGMPRPQTAIIRSTDGQVYDFEFNGIGITVNDNGELAITREGPTKGDGTVRDGVDAKTTGARLGFEKSGDIVAVLGTGTEYWRLKRDGQHLQIGVTGNVDISTAGVLVGKADEAWVCGTTFTDHLQTLTQAWNTQLQLMSDALDDAIVATGVIAQAMLVPIYGPIASAPSFDTLVAAFTAIQASILDLQSTLADDFTFNFNRYTSTKHFGESG